MASRCCWPPDNCFGLRSAKLSSRTRPSARVTRVLTSHDPRAALAEADLVLALKDGRAAYLGPPGGIEQDQIKDLYA